ncbi:unnamed protein product [Colias eurytheme]|nr:unnamed protein product [Colias eurytheme]
MTNQVKENFGSSASLSEKSVSLKETMKMMMDSSESEEVLENEIPNPVEVLIKKNINEYVLDKRIENEEDPLLWWKVNSNKYGIISPVARDICTRLKLFLDGITKFSGDDKSVSLPKWAQEDNSEIFNWTPQQILILARRSLEGNLLLGYAKKCKVSLCDNKNNQCFALFHT